MAMKHALKYALKPRALLVAAALSLSVIPARAEVTLPQGFGLGFVLGAPTGISLSLPVGANNSFNGTLGYQLSHGPNIVAFADYVWHRRDLIPVETGKVSVYFGPGASVLLSKDPEASIHAVVGIDYLFEGVPLQTFFEIGPGITILPDTRATAVAGLGLRYFF